MSNVNKDHLVERLSVLRDRVRILEMELTKQTSNFYRVCIFGSARIQPDDAIYNLTEEMGRRLGELGIDVLTGGGPGLMEAANKGVLDGKRRSGSKSRSFGITIELNKFEEEASEHLDVKHHHRQFSSRLDEFMRLSSAVVVMRGGIGTILELFFTWQLIQVGHMSPRPLILIDKKFWAGMIDWLKDYVVKSKLVSPGDLDYIVLVDTPEEATEIIEKDFEIFLKEKKERLELEKSDKK